MEQLPSASHGSRARENAHAIPAIMAMVLLPFALAHFVSYLYRTVNAVVYPELAHDLGLAANDIGMLTSAYFLAFALAQLPLGVALDRFGPRKVQVPMLMIAAAGAALFAGAHSLGALVLARALIGLGVAGSLMAAIKASSLWLPAERLPLATAVLLSVGGMGAMASTRPMHAALQYADWRFVFVVLAAGTLAVAALIFLVVPEHAKKQKTSLPEMVGAVRQLFSAWSFWRLALYSVFAHATYMAVQGLWMGPWLHDMAHLSRIDAANALLAGTMAMVAGALAFGALTDVLGKRGYRPLLVCGAGIWCFLLFQGLMIVDTGIPPIIVAVGFSFFGTATTMNYAVVAQSVAPHLTGRVSTSFNLLVFLLAFVLQWGIGSVIKLWTPAAGAYPAAAYQTALAILLALQLPGLLLWLTFKPWKKLIF